MNRRIRNRTYGGVGGREPRGSLLPDFASTNGTELYRKPLEINKNDRRSSNRSTKLRILRLAQIIILWPFTYLSAITYTSRPIICHLDENYGLLSVRL